MEPKDKPQRMRVTTSDLIVRIKTDRVRALKGLDEAKLGHVVKEVMTELARQIADSPEGVIAVPGFGQFRVMKREIEKEGTRQTVDRVVFRPAKAQPPAAEAGAAAEGAGADAPAGKTARKGAKAGKRAAAGKKVRGVAGPKD